MPWQKSKARKIKMVSVGGSGRSELERNGLRYADIRWVEGIEMGVPMRGHYSPF